MVEATPMAMSLMDDQPTEESLLVERLRMIDDKRMGCFGIHIHLSELKASNKKPHFMRIATRAFENLLNNSDTMLFKFANFDLVLICREVPVDDVDNAIYKVRALFSEDPLTAGEDGTIEDRFATWYDLGDKEDFAAFLDAASEQEAIAEAERKRRIDARAEAQQMAGDPLSPKNIVNIREALQKVRISDMIETQLALKVNKGFKAEPLFREQFVSMKILQGRVAPGINLFGSTWLFQYLTEILDKRMLQLASREDYSKLEEPLSLNLNISTINTREFQEINRIIGPHTDKFVIEFQLIDVFSDLNGYYYARDLLQDRGYRVVLDGITPMGLFYFSPATLGFDFVKIVWSKEFKVEMGKERRNDLKDQIGIIGRDKAILCRVDSEDAVGWGLGLGISRFQGRFVDSLIMAMTSKGLI